VSRNGTENTQTGQIADRIRKQHRAAGRRMGNFKDDFNVHGNGKIVKQLRLIFKLICRL
jgi:hypothetical protein